MALSPHTRTRLIRRGGKKVRTHRWLMEQHLGRPLLATEHVHHKNGNPLDNRLENLMVLSCASHMRYHKQTYPDHKPCAYCGRGFKVNPRKRRRNRCCSKTCAYALRVRNTKATRAQRKSSSG